MTRISQIIQGGDGLPVIKKGQSLIPVRDKKVIRYINLSKKKQIQHSLANWIKKHTKLEMNKAPESIKCSLENNLLIVSIHNFLTSYEKYVINDGSKGQEMIKQSRFCANEVLIEEGSLDRYIEEFLDVKVLGHMYDLLIEEDYSLWIIFLDTCFETE